MGRFVQLRSEIWSNAAVDELEHDNKFLYIYLLTSPESNLMGYYRIMPRQIASDMGTTKEKILPQLMTETKLWKYDQNTYQVLIPNFLKYNKAGSPTQLQGINRELKGLKRCHLHKEFLRALKKHCGEKAFQYIDKDILLYVKELIGEVSEIDDYHDVPLLEMINKYI